MLPFDWKSPVGYVVAWLSEILALSAGSLSIFPVLSSIFASSWLFITIADADLTQEMANFNIDVKASGEHGDGELIIRFCNIVQLYSDAKL